MSDVLVRAMVAGDVERMTEIFNQRHVAAMTLQILYTSEAERATRFAVSETQRMLVAELDGRVVGHGGLTLFARRRAHVGAIAALPFALVGLLLLSFGLVGLFFAMITFSLSRAGDGLQRILFAVIFIGLAVANIIIARAATD